MFGEKFKFKLFLLTFFSFFMGIVEFSGLCLIFPFMLLITQKDVFMSSKTVKFLFSNFAFLNEGNIVLLFAVAIVFIYVFKNVIMILYVKYQNKVISDWLMEIYKSTVEKIIYSSYAALSKITTGEKYTLLSSVITSSLWGFMHKCILMISTALIAFCILIYLFYKFTIPAVVTAVFLAVCVFLEHLYFKSRAKKIGSEILKLGKIYYQQLQYILSALKEIKISKNKKYFADKLINIYDLSNTASMYSNSNGMYPLYVTEIITVISFVVLVSLIFYLNNIEPSYMVSSVAVVCAVILRLVPLLNKIQSSMYSINTSKPSLIWFMDTYASIVEPKNNQNTSTLIEFNESLSLRGVSFKYDDNNFELKPANINIKKGEFIGIVGMSGSGKTTLFDLITGIYTPSSGSIYVDNVEINDENIGGWQKHIALLPQEFAMMQAPILNNVAWGVENSEIDINRVITSLKEAEIYEDINDIYSQTNLSVGQKHRIILARAMYQNSDVIMLDEATSSLDIETEERVSSSIAALKGKKTIIAIAHRLSTLKECDRIIYMKKGEIVDTGTFFELKQKYPDFERMINLSTFCAPNVDLNN